MAGIEVKARTALVTGSSRGIGRGIALKLADCGVRPIGVHFQKNRELAEQTARLLRERGAEPVLIQADVDKPRGHLPGCSRKRGRRSARSTFSSPTPGRMCSTSTSQFST